MNKDLEQYTLNTSLEQLQLIRDLCVIPSPSLKEDKRAVFCFRWFKNNGFENVYIDDMKNVVAVYDDDGKKDVIIFSAHTDVVFENEDKLELIEDDKYMHCPGICDDTANLCNMMLAARYFVNNKYKSKYGIIFVANSCEEGLGNLKGIKNICDKYKGRIKAHISFDGTDLKRVVCDAVGSRRYEVIVKTEGGHSFANFGNENAIFVLSKIIEDIYSIDIPKINNSKTTYNVGTISGGTSVNTIAQDARMLCEYRSDNKDCLEIMNKYFEDIFNKYRNNNIDIIVNKVGDRPCKGDVDKDKHQQLIDIVDEIIKDITKETPLHLSGSTDCNISLSLGIPAIVVTSGPGYNVHRRDEYINKDEQLDGLRLALSIMSYFLYIE